MAGNAPSRVSLAWANLPLRTKGLVVVAIPLVALLATLVSFYLLQAQEQQAEARVKRTLEVRAKIQQVHTILLAEETWVRARVLARLQGAPLPAVPTGTFSSQSIARVLADLKALLQGDPGQFDRLQKVKNTVEELLGLAYILVESPGAELVSGAAVPQRVGEFLSESQLALNEISLQLGYMLDEEDRNLDEWTAQAKRVWTWNLAAIAVSAAFGLGGGILAVVLFTAGVSQRIRRSEDNARRLAEGLVLLPMLHGSDEIGRLGRALDEARALLGHRDATVEARTRDLQEANRQLEIASQHKSAFLANVSHELRTPLNAIIGFTRLVLRRTEGQIPELQRENLNKVLVSAEHLLTLINGLLDLSKIEAGKMEVFVESFRVEEVLDVAIATVEPALKDGVRLIRRIQADIPPLNTDREKLKQIILNLAGNAAKFTERGQLEISAARDDGMFKLVVTDTGIGIAKEALEDIFEAFRQADMSMTKKYGGTGLGLTIVKRFVQLLGGEIHVDSEVGKGSAFTVRLPMQFHP